MTTAPRQQVVDIARRMVRDGLVRGTSGNVSTRLDDDHVAVTPGSVEYEALEATDIPVVDLAGHIVEGALNPSSELPLHLALYHDSDVGAVVHTHSLHAAVVSCVDDRLPNIHYMTASMGGAVPVVPYARYGSSELATSVAAAMQGRKAVIMGNHGAVTVGETLIEAYTHSLNLEWMCELFVKASQHGEPTILGDAEVAAVSERMQTRGYLGPSAT